MAADLCGCGCGAPVKPGRRYVATHYARTVRGFRKHGASAYGSGSCKCDTCTEAHRQRHVVERARRRAARVLIDGRLVAPIAAELHGRASTYANHGCHCDPCREAGRAKNARDVERRRSAS